MTQKHQLRFQSHVFSNSNLVELKKNIVQPNAMSCLSRKQLNSFFVLVVLHVIVSKAKCPVFSRVIKFFL